MNGKLCILDENFENKRNKSKYYGRWKEMKNKYTGE